MPWTDRFGRFVAWWLGELRAACAPIITRLTRPTRRALFALEGDQLTVREAGRDEPLLQLVLDESAQPVADRVTKALPGRWRHELVLPASVALIRELGLPAAASENLRAVLEFELDRLTPFKAAQVYFDFLRLGAGADGITVRLVCVPKAVIDPSLQRLAARGVRVDAVTLAQASVSECDLLPAELRAVAGDRRWVWLNRGLAATAALLLLVAVAYPIWAKRERLAALAPLVERARAGAAVSERISEELDRRIEEHNHLLARKQAQVPAIDVLEQVTRLLPDTAWVQQIEIKQGKTRDLIVQGEVATGAKVIEMFEQSGLVQNTSFKSPLTRGAAPTADRFHVGGELLSRPLPEPLAEEVLLADAKAVREATAAKPEAGKPAPAPSGAAGPPASPASAPPTAPSPATPPAAGKPAERPTERSPAKPPAVPGPLPR